MVELRDAATHAVIPGHERAGSLIMDAAGQIDLKWVNATAAPAAGAMVEARVYFRDATIYALGAA
jgi:hypothetical protein